MSKDTAKLERIDRAAFYLATDPEKMRHILSEHLPARLGLKTGIDDLWIPRVIPRGKGGFAIQYNMTLGISADRGKTALTLFGYLYGPDEKQQPQAGVESRFIELDCPRLSMPIFPYDPDLPDLPDFIGEKTAAVKLSAPACAMGHNPDGLSVREIRVLGYRLGRRCVIGYEFSVPGCARPIKAVAKLIRGAAQSRPWQTLQAFGDEAFLHDAENRLTVPRVYMADGDAVFMEFVGGSSLHDLIGQDDFATGCAGAGQILRRLHESQIELTAAHTWREELAALERKLLVTSDLFPEWGDRLDQAIDALRQNAFRLDGADEPAVLHRDFYDKQILYSNDRLTLLDCDMAAMGDPALDYGNFIAHLRLRACQAPEHAAGLSEAGGVFGEAYGEVDGAFEERAAWWTAAALVRLACLYGLRPRWRRLAPGLLDDALGILRNRYK